MSNAMLSRRTMLIGPAVAIAVGVVVGFVWGWADASRLAEPGGHSMDEGLARGLMTVVAGVLGVVGLVLLVTPMRRGGALLLATALSLFVAYQLAIAVGPKEPSAVQVPASVMLTLLAPSTRANPFSTE